jgi:hypothetical protein
MIFRIIPFSICFVIAGFFFLEILRNAVNIPNGDDFFCLLLFTQQYQDSGSWLERFRLITEHWLEHRIFYSRLTALVSYWIHGQVNFYTIQLIGNLTLVGFTLLFWRLLKKTDVSLYYLIPVVLTLFSPVMYEGNVWAGASTVYMPVCFLGLLTIYLLFKPSRISFLLAILTALAATFSFGNGMFSFAAGLGLLLYEKRYKHAVIWSAFMLIAVVLYFQDISMASSTDAFGFAVHFQRPAYLFYNLFSFVGGTMDYLENDNSPVLAGNYPAIFFGLLLTAGIIWGVIDCFLKKPSLPARSIKTIWLGMVMFIGITAVAMAYSRTSGESMNTLSSRYKIYSMVVLILVYVWCLVYFQRKKLVGLTFGVLSFTLLLFNYFVHYEDLVNYKSSLMSGVYNYKNNHTWVIYRHTSYFEGAVRMIADSIESNPCPVYKFENIFPGLTQQTLKKAKAIDQIQILDQHYEGKSVEKIILQSDIYPLRSCYQDGVYLVVYNEKNIYLFAASPLKNGRISMIKDGHYFKDGFYIRNNLAGILTKDATYNLAVYCPAEKEKIRLINLRING